MIPAELLPPIPRPPHDPTFTLLGGSLGWRVLDQQSTVIDPATGELTLAMLPAAARSLSEPSGSLGGLVPPANVAFNAACEIWLAAHDGVIKRFDPCECAFTAIPCQRPAPSVSSIAICGDKLFVASSRGVAVFVLPELRPYAEWPSPKAVANTWQPSAITVDQAHRVWVADIANGGVHRFSASGRWQKFIAGFGVPRHLASDCDGRVYVICDNQPGARVLDADGNEQAGAATPDAIAGRFAPMPFSVDAAGRLNLSALCLTPGSPFDLDGNHVAAPPTQRTPQRFAAGSLIAGPLDSRIYQCQWHRVMLSGSVPRGGRIRVSTYTSEAALPDVQMTLPGLAWHVHPAADTQSNGEWDCLIQSPPGRYLWLKLDLEGDGFSTPRVSGARVEFPRISLRRYLPAVFGEDPISADFLDRFLAIFDTSFRSIENTLDQQAALFDPRSTPASFLPWLASWIGVRLNRQLPEDRLRHMLAAAGHTLRCRGTRTGLHRQLLDFIGWRMIDADCPPETRCRGRATCPPTPERKCCALPPVMILEHFQIRRWLFAGVGRLGDCSMLWGRRIVNRSQLNEGAQVGGTQLVTSNDPLRDPFHTTAHRFTVFVPGRIEDSDGLRRSLLNLVASESPAHTAYQVEFVRPRFRIGFQSSIGLDSVVARRPAGSVTLDTSKLGRGSFLTGSRKSGLPAEIGKSTLLNL